MLQPAMRPTTVLTTWHSGMQEEATPAVEPLALPAKATRLAEE